MPGNYNLGTASGRIEVDGKGASKGFDVAKQSANAFGTVVQKKVDSVEQLGRKMAITGAAGVAGFGIAVKAAVGFQQQMSAVQAVTNSSGDELDALTAKALDLGKKTVFSASEAGQAIEELAKAGVPVADILNGAADAAVNLAAAGGVDLASAATISANAMNSFEMNAKDVVGIADILAGVANTSASDVSGIGESLSQVGAVAHLAGLDFRDTAIAIGEMADAGIKGSDAGTSIKTMLLNLIPTTNKQIDEFKRLNLLTTNLADANKTLAKVTGGPAQDSIEGVNKQLAKYVEEMGNGNRGTMKNAQNVQKLLMMYGGLNNEFFTANGEIKNLAGIQGVLGKATKGMSKEQQLASLQLLFGTDAMRGAAIMAQNGRKGYNDFSKAVAKTSAADVAKTRLNNLSGATEQLRGSLETAEITIGNIFLPILTRIVQAVTSVVNVFNNLPGPIQKAIGIIIGIVSILSIMIGLFLASITAIAAFILQWYAFKIIRIATGFLKTFLLTMRGGAGVQAAFAAGLETSTKRTKMFILQQKIAAATVKLTGRAALLAGKIMKFAFSPLGLVIIALVIAFILLYKHSETFRNAVNRLVGAIKNGLIAAWNALKPVLLSVLAALISAGKWIASTLMPVIKQVAAAIMGQLMKAFQEIWSAVKADLLPALKELVSQFQGNVVPAFHKIAGAVGPLLPVIGKFAAIVGKVLLGAWITYAKFMISKVYPILIKIIGFLLGAGIQGLVQFVLGIVKVITGVINVITGVVKIIKGIFTGDWAQVWEGAKQVFKGFIQIFLGSLQMMAAAVLGLLKAFGGKVLGWFKSLFNKSDGATGGWISKIIGFFVSLATGIASIAKAIFTTVIKIFTTAFAVLSAIWTGYWNTFGPVLKAAFGVVVAIIQLVWAVIKGVFLLALIAIIAVVKNQFTMMKTIIMAALRAIMAVIRPGLKAAAVIFRAVWGAVKAATSAAWNAIKPIVNRGVGFVKDEIRGLKVIWGVIKGIWDRVKQATTAAWNKLKDSVVKGVRKIQTTMQEAKRKFLDPILNLGQNLYDAGAKIMDMLLKGITAGLEKVKDKINEATGWIKDHLPGSPVKEGALRVLNRGYAGKKIMEMVADGIGKNAMMAARAMAGATQAIRDEALLGAPLAQTFTHGPSGGASPAAFVTSRPPRRKPTGGKAGSAPRSRIVEGTMRIDERGRVWVEGIAEDVFDDLNSDNDERFARG
jgi:phage-related protein